MDTHDEYTDRLSEYIDGDLAARERARLESHLEACGGCRETLAELRAVVARAAALEDAPPDHDLWSGVEQRLEPRLRGGGRAFVRPSLPRRFSFTLPQLMAAGLALMVLSGGLVWLARLGGPATDFDPVVAREQSVEVRPANFAETHYDEAIADLEQTLRSGRARLDPATVRVVEENLQAIDRAIEQCRSALEADPANTYLNSHLADAKKRKLALLRRATALATRG
jgi:hypothetical protein